MFLGLIAILGVALTDRCASPSLQLFDMSLKKKKKKKKGMPDFMEDDDGAAAPEQTPGECR